MYFKKFDHNSYCQTRYVLIALENYSDDINFSFNNDFILFYVSKGKPNDTDYKNLLDKMFTSGEHNFKLINNYIHHNGGNNKHTSKIPSTVDVNLNVIQNEKIFSKNPEELYYSIFESYYEGLTYADYLFGNIKFGEWYPSKDITLHDYKDSMILELTFKNGDTNFENQKLNINYSQKISYCHHNLYKPYFKTKSIYHPAKVHFDYNKDEWIENSPSYYEDEYKYWYDNDFNWETNKTYSKIISR